MIESKLSYIGRFAPSPSGGLHFGSLVAALAGYLDARSNNGQWLLRIDNIDPPREKPGAAQAILETLESFGLDWDQQVIFQSHRYANYLDLVCEFLEKDLAYPCYCSRKQLASLEKYPGTCRKKLNNEEKKKFILELREDAKHVFDSDNLDKLKPMLANYAIRYDTSSIKKDELGFFDKIRGRQEVPDTFSDFIIFRKDRLPSYMLACAYDDLCDNINNLVRGADLLESCFWQRSIQLNIDSEKMAQIEYAHLPVIKNELDQKLSKQHFAEEIDNNQRELLLLKALRALGQEYPDSLWNEKASTILEWAISNWKLDNIERKDLFLDQLEV